MATQTISILPMATYQPASRSFGPLTVPVGVIGALLLFDTTNMHSTTTTAVADLRFELSQDAGATWLPWGACTLSGAPGNDPKTGLPRTGFHVELPNPTNPDRRLRGTVDTTEAITTAVSVQLES